MIALHLDPAINELTAGLERTNHNVQAAIKRALRKTIMWLRRQVLQQISRDVGVTQKKISQYRRVFVEADGLSARLWVGLNPLPLHETGRVSWSPRAAGARVNGREYAGSFYSAIYGSTKKIWIRSSRNRTEGHAMYHRLRRYRAFSGEVSHGRFPVELLGAPLDDAIDENDRRLAQRAEVRFKSVLAQELNYQRLKGRGKL